ncbi:31121_t:CDS:2 [Gigaspora margarita]|uniref:31121_t:CDS:1 n=1 Tax=Gigaspora margarita TaxID=4874 RepID=A0ABN7W1V5_GIGMA|nr:31121_t:CDS:2 [Gigaspora margarita]
MCSVNNMSTTALMEAAMFEICKETEKIIYTCPDSFEFDEIIHTVDNFLTTQENVDDMIYINENNAVNNIVYINKNNAVNDMIHINKNNAVNNMIYINENNAVSELNKDEIEINNTNSKTYNS